MKKVFVILLLIISQAVLSEAANQFPQDFVKSYIKGCLNRGRERGDNDEYVKYFCNCSIQVLQDNYTFEEFKKLDDYRIQGKSPEDDEKFQKVLRKMERCKDDAPKR
jgi:hypothetical protein